MRKLPFGVAVFIAHAVVVRLFPNFNDFGAYYNETATPKSTTHSLVAWHGKCDYSLRRFFEISLLLRADFIFPLKVKCGVSSV